MANEYKLTKTDQTKWIKNTVLFSAPVALIYLGFVQTGITTDGFQWSDFIPNEFVIGSMITYLISTTIDLIKKFISSTI